MSFVVSSSGDLARNLWPHFPHEQITCSNDPHSSEDVENDWQLIPEDSDALSEWLKVVSKASRSDPEHRYDVVHASNEPGQNSRLVTVRIQGFLAGFSLQPVMNDVVVSPHEKRHAHYFVKLRDLEPASPAWNAQTTAVSLLRYIILRSTPDCPHDRIQMETTPRDMFYFARPKFIPGAPNTYRSSRSTQSCKFNPVAGRPSKHGQVGDSFKPNDAVSLYRRNMGGSLGRATHTSFSIGDFVDVLFSFDISHRTYPPKVHLNLESLVLLKSASEIHELVADLIKFPSPRRTVAPPPSPSRFEYVYDDQGDAPMENGAGPST